MELLAIITVLILIQVLFFGYEVGKARGKYNIKAPAVSGHESFDKHYRVHQNTIEQIVIFIFQNLLLSIKSVSSVTSAILDSGSTVHVARDRRSRRIRCSNSIF